MAAAPNNAPRPITPVSMARAAPPVEVVEVAAFTTEDAIVEVGFGASEVKGVSDAEVAPGNATEVVLGFGVAEALSGLRTLYMY